MKTIGHRNIDIVEAIVMGHLEHGSMNIQESAMLDIPKRIFEIHDEAIQEVEQIISGLISREKIGK